MINAARITGAAMMMEPGDSTLPLVLLTIGDADGEFEALYDHLEKVTREAEPDCQSLIIARPEFPKMLYNVLRMRIKEIPHVHLRRLGSDTGECMRLKHSTGTFLVNRDSLDKGG